MRLTQQQRTSILQATREAFGGGAQVWLFGSRARDDKRGGDIDLLVRPSAEEPEEVKLARKLRFLGLLERQLGERRIDVVIERSDDRRAIVKVAHDTGVQL